MKVGDVIRVKEQPHTQFARIENERGFIEEIEDGEAQITTLSPDGQARGGGWIPLECLELETDLAWHTAKTWHDAYLERLLVQYDAHNKRWKAKLQEVADKHGLTLQVVSDIFGELKRLSDR